MKINETTRTVGLTQFLLGGHEALFDENFASKQSAENHFLYSRVGEIVRVARSARTTPYGQTDVELPTVLAQIILEVMNLASAFGVDLEKYLEIELKRLAERIGKEQE